MWKAHSVQRDCRRTKTKEQREAWERHARLFYHRDPRAVLGRVHEVPTTSPNAFQALPKIASIPGNGSIFALNCMALAPWERSEVSLRACSPASPQPAPTSSQQKRQPTHSRCHS
eukprot:633239-Rhodomonas_salina.2